MAGDYERLVAAFHADTDADRRQLAAAGISRIAPSVSHDAMGGADAAAGDVLAVLYPQEVTDGLHGS